MKKILGIALLSLLCFSIRSGAQNTTVTATVVDSDSTAWANGTWSLSLIPSPNNPNVGTYTIGGSALSPTMISQIGSMDGSGVLSITTYQSNAISPGGTLWALALCPNASVGCSVYQFSTGSNSSMNISSALTAFLPAPRFSPVSGAYGYNTTEAALSLRVGSTFWNVTNTCTETYGGVSWSCPTGSGLGTVTTVSVNTANGVSGTVTNPTTTPAITLILGAITPTSTNGVSAATMAFMDATSSVQTQLNAKLASATAAATYAPIFTLTTTGTSGAATYSGNVLNIPQYSGVAGVSSINSVTGAFTFNGAGVSCTSTTCTFSSSGGGDTITSPNSSLTIGGTAAATTLDALLTKTTSVSNNATYLCALFAANSSSFQAADVSSTCSFNPSTGNMTLGGSLQVGGNLGNGTGGYSAPCGSGASTTVLSSYLYVGVSANCCPAASYNGAGYIELVDLSSTQSLSGKSIAASEINSGQVAVAQGGSAAATVAAALSNFLGNPATGTYTVTCSSSSSCAASTTALIANTTFTNATTAIGGNACSASAVPVTLTGLATSSVLFITPSTDVSGSTGWGSSGGLVIDAWPSASNTMSYKICNQTSGSITPAAVTWNVSAK